ncbi:hypothetical protein HY628_00080 [Candidatus Uhrbacteria bacterium]|nr:hypothetical protein [Candidatus Uhrbacteria bacterium]
MFENQSPVPPPPPAEDIFEKVEPPSPSPARPLPPPPGSVGLPGLEEKSGVRPRPFIIGGVVLVLLGAVGVGVWYFFLRPSPETRPSPTSAPSLNNVAPPSPPPAPVSVCGNTICESGETPTLCPSDCAPLPPPPADSDNDGLTDTREAELGTNPNLADTDGDGLFDREEVTRYGTDPAKSDTDGDGFPDGTEVQNGYDPNGSGRLLEVPR